MVCVAERKDRFACRRRGIPSAAPPGTAASAPVVRLICWDMPEPLRQVRRLHRKLIYSLVNNCSDNNHLLMRGHKISK
jgi:hypothetical protein